MHKLIIPLLFIILACNNKQPGFSYENQIQQFRKEYMNGFLTEERSPLKEDDLVNLDFFNTDSGYLVSANFEILPNEKPFDIKTSSGKTKPYRKYAKLDFELKGNKYRLYVYESLKLKNIEEYKDYLFLPFTDLSNGEESYGGGRYIDLSRKEFENGMISIDFNKAYNPWCAYSDGYNCPVPPAENDLDIIIIAGEKKYKGEHKGAKH